MFLLKKIFQLRDKANPDMEKPFLEHLEDLRVTITRIIVTLLIATVACFVLRDNLMEILRRPVEQVWLINQANHLPAASEIPKPVDVDTWEKAKRIADSITGLSIDDRAAFFRQLDAPDLRFHVEAVFLYRAALEVPKDRRESFLASITNLDPALRKQVTSLLEKEPSARISDREDLRLMGAFNPTEAFMLSIKLAFFAGIVVSFPLLLLFTLQFVMPGLHKHEKRALFPAMVIGFGLFVTGVLFAYFIVLPRVLEFFFSYAREMGIANEWRIGYYISFATQFTLIFGLAFELPVVVMTLVKIGLLGYESMRNTRTYAILAIFVVAAVITPTPDAFTLCLLAVPMVLLYEICIWLAWGIHRKERKREAEEEKERMATLLAAPPVTPSDSFDPSGSSVPSDCPPGEEFHYGTPDDPDYHPDPPADDEAGETEDRGDALPEAEAATDEAPPDRFAPYANPDEYDSTAPEPSPAVTPAEEPSPEASPVDPWAEPTEPAAPSASTEASTSGSDPSAPDPSHPKPDSP